MKLPRKYLILFVFAPLLLGISAWNYYQTNYSAPPHLTVSFLAIGQGDAIYVKTPNGSDVLIDTGPNASITNKLSAHLHPRDTALDLVVITHPDQDHIGGFSAILDKYTIHHLLTTEKEATSKTFQKIKEKIASESGMNTIIARAGQRIVIDPDYGVYIDVLFPDDSITTITDTNESSIIFELVYGDTEFLFTGDAPSSVENYLVATAKDIIATDVVKLGHHGSKTSSSEEFLQATHATYAIVSAGKNNKYGHPHAEVVTRVHNQGIQLFSTVDDMVTFTSDGKTISVN